MRPFRLFCSAIALASASPTLAEGFEVRSAAALAERVGQLKPGDWAWAPRIAPRGPVLVYVELDRQLASVYRNGILMGVSTISSGKPGFETPNGVFTILEKDKDHRSRTYDDAPMPYQQRLTWKGVALHAGNLPGYPASHGCVRLPMEFAKLLFATTEMGGTVVIAGRHGEPYRRPVAGVLAPVREGGYGQVALPLGDKQEYSWQPQLSPSGPVSIIVSSGDQAVVVLRNGIEIGRARAAIAEGTTDAQVLTLARPKRGRSDWIQVGVNDVAPEDAAIISTRGAEQMHLPPAFLPLMRSVMTPGTTVLITRASMSPATTGGQTTVLASEGDAERR